MVYGMNIGLIFLKEKNTLKGIRREASLLAQKKWNLLHSLSMT